MYLILFPFFWISCGTAPRRAVLNLDGLTDVDTRSKKFSLRERSSVRRVVFVWIVRDIGKLMSHPRLHLVFISIALHFR